MNTIICDRLPRNITPFEAWFGRKYSNWTKISERRRACRDQIRQDQAARQYTSESVSSSKIKIATENDSIATENNSNMLTEIGHRVLEHKKKQATRIIKKKSRVKISFKKKNIVWLQIPKKIHRPTKPIKLPCCVLELSRKVSDFYLI
jgi:hypothetical protein